MILDDLFTFAAQNSTSANQVTVQASVTTNHTGGLRPPVTNKADVQPALRLVYVPGREIKEDGASFFSAASFQTQELTITAPRANFRGSDTYNVVWLGNTFTALSMAQPILSTASLDSNSSR
jgi:hypothetical protein